MSAYPSKDIEILLDAGSVASTDERQRIRDHLADSFAAYLGQAFEPVWDPAFEDISPGSGFAFGIRSRSPLGGPLSLEWYGVLLHRPAGRTEAVILIFAQDARVIPSNGGDYLSFEYASSATGVREWRSLGWERGEMDEWEGYQHLTEVCRRMSEGR